MITRFMYPVDYMTVAQADEIAQILRSRHPPFDWRLPPGLKIDLEYAHDSTFIDGPKAQRIKYGVWLWQQLTAAEKWAFHEAGVALALHACARTMYRARCDLELPDEELMPMEAAVAAAYQLVTGVRLDVARPPAGLYNDERSRHIQTDVPPPVP